MLKRFFPMVWVTIFIMIFGIVCFYSVFAQTNPVVHYKFDETSGTTAADSSGSGKNATITGGTWVAGKIGNAVNLSGGSQYVSLPSGVMSALNDFSIATWVKLDTTGSWRRIFDFGTGTTVNMFLTPTSGTAIRYAITTSGSGGEQRINGTAALPTGSWKHVAVALAGSVGILYVDGVEVGRNSSMTLRPSSLGSTTQNWIGRSEYSSDPYLDGQIDDFRIYDRALSAAEVQALFGGTATPTSVRATNTPTPTRGATVTPTPTQRVTPTSRPSSTPTPTQGTNTPTPTQNVTSSWVVRPFDLNQVTLQSSLFTGNRDRTITYLKYLDDNRMLYNFRATAGLSTNGAAALGGWDAPDCNLRGHSTGHYLSALAQAYASSGDSALKTKIDYMVTELGKCQDAMPSKGYSAGYLAGYPETQFIQLESLATYPTIWAPYYTCHKIMAGLIACYKLAGNSQALTIVSNMGDWVYSRLSKLPRTQLQQMWGLYIAGEFGGMNEVMAELYAITGKQTYLTTATYFDNDKLFTPCSNNQDQLNGLHANQHIPQTVGALRVYDQNNNSYYYNVASNFWNMVTGHHMYIIGGTGEGEMFKGVDQIASYITANTCETCATYNMLKLTRNLFFHNPDPKYMDYYERALYNDILASQDQASSHGFVTYFMPLNPGGRKTYTNDYSAFTCCHGTGMENHTKYQESIYFYSADQSTLYVNLYVPSTLNWSAKGFTFTQTTSYPTQEATSITVNGSGQLAIKLRVPFWVKNGYTVKINGTQQSITPTPGTYVTISRVWASGDKIDISMPFGLSLERTPDNSTIGGFMYGPILLVGKSTSASYITMPANPTLTSTGTPLNFTANGVTLVPMYSAYNFNYHAYFKIQ